MHPAQKRHVYSMIEMIKHALKSIEAALVDYEATAHDFKPLGNRNITDPSAGVVMTAEEEKAVAAYLGLEDPVAEKFASLGKELND